MGSSGPKDSGEVTRARLSARRRGQAATTKPQAQAAQPKAELELVPDDDQRSSDQVEWSANLLLYRLGFSLTAKPNAARNGAVDVQWEASSFLRESVPSLPRFSAVFGSRQDATRNALQQFHDELGRLLGLIAAVLVLLSMSACDGGGFGIRWFLSQPFAVQVGEGVPFEQSEVVRAIREGIEQFGGTVNERPAKQTIVVEYDPECSCSFCINNAIKSDKTAAFVVQRSYDHIEVCPRSEVAIGDLGQARAADLILKHELGHVLGLIEHQPDGLMQEVIDNRLTIRTFQPSDLSAICKTGRIVSTTCQAK